MQQYSVLMSVYKKENPNYLFESMESIFNQTIKTNDFVLVCDGPLTAELDSVIDMEQSKHNDIFHIIRLEKNGGLGNALNIGLKYCKNELVARMDSDDISYKNRCEKQIEVFERYDVDIVSGIVYEFSDDVNDVDAIRQLPEKSDDIRSFSKKRNPFNHPCVMYKKSVVEASGGYKDFYLLEDYYLWVRMLNDGAKGYNLQEPLLMMRAGKNMYKRRSGIDYAKSQSRLFIYMKNIGYISTVECGISILVRAITSVVPNDVRKMLYKVLLRK